jgi:hypothetical protein
VFFHICVLLGENIPHHNHEKISNTFCTNLHPISFQCKFEFHSIWGICNLELSIFYQNNDSIIIHFIVYFFKPKFLSCEFVIKTFIFSKKKQHVDMLHKLGLNVHEKKFLIPYNHEMKDFVIAIGFLCY